MDRVVVFLDYQNVQGWARRQFYSAEPPAAVGHVDPLRLARHIVRRRRRPSDLAQVRVYRGRPNPDRQPASAAANDRQSAVWDRSELVHVIRRPLQYRPGWPDVPAAEKGIDVSIAVDLVRLAIDEQFDVAVLFSSDTDLLPAVETLIDLRLAHVEVAAWSGASRLRLPGSQLPWCHHVDQKTFRTLEDHTDYTRRLEF